MMFQKGQILELKIESLAFGGEAVSKIRLENGQSLVVFIEGKVIPGEIVEAEITKIKKNFLAARAKRIISPSNCRNEPRCKHFAVCGGCSFQHISYDDQLKYKQTFVEDALRQIGGFKGLNIKPVIGCKNPWFYRNKMEYSFSESAGKIVLGLHVAKRFQDVFDMQECFLQSENSAKIANAVKDFCRQKCYSAYNPQKNSGLLKNLVVRESKNTGDVLINIILNGEKEEFEDDDFIKLFRQDFPFVTSIYKTLVTIKKGHRTVVEEKLIYGNKTIKEILSVDYNGKKISLEFEILPQSFFQPNTLQAQLLYGKILEFADARKGQKAYDLFCGTGTIGMFIAKTGCSVTGIEINSSAIENARKSVVINSIKNIEFICNDIGESLPPQESEMDILITDPPRAGISQKSLAKIAGSKINKWIYVSCNPSTLARDLKFICENGFEIKDIQPVDMFPQTYHVETVCNIIKK